MLVKPLILGVAKVYIRYDFEPKTCVDKKQCMTRVITVPVSTTVTVELGAIRNSATVRCSKNDHFVYETGRKLALRRALAKTSLTKEDRRRIWDEYNKLKPNGRW